MPARIETRLSPDGEWRKSGVLAGGSVVVGRAQFDGAPDAKSISREHFDLRLSADGAQVTVTSMSGSPSHIHDAEDDHPTRLAKGQAVPLAYAIRPARLTLQVVALPAPRCARWSGCGSGGCRLGGRRPRGCAPTQCERGGGRARSDLWLFSRAGMRKRILPPAPSHNTGARDWRALALTQVHHGSRLSNS